MRPPSTRALNLLIIAAGTLFFLPFIGGMNLIDWDELNFAEIAREMIVTGDFLSVQVNFEPFYEKPPLFFWLQAASMKLFGVNEFAARFPNVMAGIVTMLVAFHIGKRLYKDATFGILWAAMWLASFLPHLYFKSGIIDPWYNLLTFLSLYFLIRLIWERKEGRKGSWKWVWLAGTMLALALLTKGPALLLVVMLVLLGYWAVKRFSLFMSPLQFLVFVAISISLYSIWSLQQIGFSGIADFVDYQVRLLTTHDAGHSGFPGYHIVTLLLGAFPASVLAFGVIGVKRSHRPVRADFMQWMVILLVVVLVVFSIVRTKIVHYSSLAYFPITFLAALTLFRAFRGRRFNRGLKLSLIISTGVLALIVLAVPYVMNHSEWLIGKTDDFFTKAVLSSNVNWSLVTYLPGLLLAFVVGWTIWLWYRRLRKIWVPVYLGGLMVAIASMIIVFMPRAEHYLQRPAIEFFESLEGKDVYITTANYKSYAYYFYAKTRPGQVVVGIPEDLDKELYVSLRRNAEANQTSLNEQLPLEVKGGFAFFRIPASLPGN